MMLDTGQLQASDTGIEPKLPSYVVDSPSLSSSHIPSRYPRATA